MITIFYGLVLLSGTIAAFWRLRPQNGVPHPWAMMPYLEVMIPIGITAGIAFGICFLVAGVMGFNPL
jgi:hypothetical protein